MIEMFTLYWIKRLPFRFLAFYYYNMYNSKHEFISIKIYKVNNWLHKNDPFGEPIPVVISNFAPEL